MVFSMTDPDDPVRRVDLFVKSPFPFEDFWARAVEVQLEGIRVRIAAIDDLIAMKRSAGRAQDLIDVEVLESIQRERHDDER